MNKRFSYPKRYWVYLFVFLICAALLIGNIYRTDSWTGNKPFSEFTQRDFKLLFIFLFEEIVIAALMILFCLLACKTIKKRCAEIAEQWKKSKYSGIKPGD